MNKGIIRKTLSKISVNNISVVTVTFNNAGGLDKTLRAVASLRTRPLEVIIVDGGSRDPTPEVIVKYQGELNILVVSEKDEGIYDAMNKGKDLASGAFIHYLNAGDTIDGDPYADISEPCIYPFMLKSEDGDLLGKGKPGIFGLSYNHQAIIFPRDHEYYDLRYSVAADFDLILKQYPGGIASLPMNDNATTFFQYGGISSVRGLGRDFEMFRIILKRKGMMLSAGFLFYALAKSLLPRKVRRFIRWSSRS